MKSRNTRRKFGQNYLKDPAILIQMGIAIDPKKSENILEIGPGLGALTDQLNLEGVNIVGIDIDEENINYLKKKFHGPAQFNFISETIETKDLAMAHSIVQICFVIPNFLGGLIVAAFADMISVKQMYMYAGIVFCFTAIFRIFLSSTRDFYNLQAREIERELID